MNELIKITEQDGNQVSSARELYNFLGVETDFTTWCKRMFEYGFEEGVDYSLLKIGERNAHNKIDFALTLDTAKEICMLQRSVKGKEARKYYIEFEKTHNKGMLVAPNNYGQAMRALAEQWDANQLTLKQLQDAENKIDNDKSKVVFAETVTGSSNSILVRKFAKDLCNNGFDIGQNRLYEWFRDNKYLNIDNEPYQNYVSQGLFEVITRAVGGADSTFTVKTTKITGKGQTYFAKKIKETY